MDTIHEKKLVIKKSEFITSLHSVSNEKEASEILASIKKEHYKATHHCYAYILGEKSEKKKFSDDKEPAGTAGKPILSVLENRELTYVLAVVTRYFGGVKLGASNLTRAYANAVSECLDEAKVIRKEKCIEITCTCDYNLYGKLNLYFTQNNYRITSSSFANDAMVSAFVPEEKYAKACADIIDLTNGKCETECSGTEFVTV